MATFDPKTCVYCVNEFCFICVYPDAEGKCCCGGRFGFTVEITITPQIGAPAKTGDMMRDVLSTGRKRAAEVAPIVAGMPCEWSGLRFAGGGIHPIIGCNGGIASDRHHGPDKSTLNNEVYVNLHRLCDDCHNRWHALNDKYYPGNRPDAGVAWLPVGDIKSHDPVTRATPAEIVQSNTWWQIRPENRKTTLDDIRKTGVDT